MIDPEDVIWISEVNFSGVWALRDMLLYRLVLPRDLTLSLYVGKVLGVAGG